MAASQAMPATLLNLSLTYTTTPLPSEEEEFF
jgi:hypothetical protein